MKNKSVGSHSVDFMLSCTHINIEPVEAAVFVPSVGEKRICTTCQKEGTILKVGRPFWEDAKENDLKKD